MTTLKTFLRSFQHAVPGLSCGTLVVVLVSCVLFGAQTYFHHTTGIFSVGASVFEKGHLHKLLIFSFYHKTCVQLLLNVIVFVFLSSSLEKGVGTVRFLFLFFLLSSTTGFFYSFVDLLQQEVEVKGEDIYQGHTEGLVPVTLACVALTTMHTKMTKGFLCGVSFPTIALPWVLLIITTAVVPHSVLPCNVIAILVGWMHGRGWFSLLDVSEARAGVLEKSVLFRWMKNITCVTFIPASTEERRKTLLPKINPTPGSYPVQAYAPLSSVNAVQTSPMMHDGWLQSPSALPAPTPPLHVHGHGLHHSSGHYHGPFSQPIFNPKCDHSHSHSHGHSHAHGHGHSHAHGHE